MARKDKDSFFIGWGETPAVDRRFLMLASLGLLGVAAGGGALIASEQAPPGNGSWNPDDERDWAGVLVRAPFPMLRTRAIDGTVRTAYLVSSSKLGVQHRLSAVADGPVVVRGSLIARGANAMIAVTDGDAWLRPARAGDPIGDGLSDWPVEDAGPASYAGEILDSKCWFGAMQPGQGKPHKSCAALCIRGGLPPVFCPEALCGSAASAPLLTDADGNPHGPGLLPFVADPILASGRIVQIGDVRQFRVGLTGIRRL
ncbi:MAG: hypothetical protein ACKVRO_00595 [Micropepsaceae bacterium]